MPPDHLVWGFFVVGGTGREQHGHAAGGAIKAPVQRRRPLPAAETGRSCWGSVLIFQSPDKGLWKNQQTQPVALLSPRFPTARNVYQERCLQTFGLGIFICGGRYRTRTAAEATAACGGNREPRLGPRSDFSKPCQGAAEKSANATRCCCLARGSQRLGMSTGMTAVLWWAVQDSNRDKQRQDIPMRAVSCLLIF